MGRNKEKSFTGDGSRRDELSGEAAPWFEKSCRSSSIQLSSMASARVYAIGRGKEWGMGAPEDRDGCSFSLFLFSPFLYSNEVGLCIEEKIAIHGCLRAA